MTKQKIKNMNLVLTKIEGYGDIQTGLIEHEATQELKTLTNTYGTMLNDIKRLTNTEFKKSGIDSCLYKQGESFKTIVKNIEGVLIPSQLSKGNYRTSENLTTVNSRLGSIIRDINWLTKEYALNKKLEPLFSKLRHLHNESDVLNATYGVDMPDDVQKKYNSIVSKIRALQDMITEEQNK